MNDASKNKKVTTKGLSFLFVRVVANTYLEHSYMTLEDLASRFGITPRMASDILYRGIAEDILAESIAEQVYYRMIHSNRQDIQRRTARWDAAFEEREKLRELKRMQKSHIN